MKVAVTGGICTGKSTVCKMLSDEFGLPVFYSDIHAKIIADTDDDVRQEVIKLLGEESYKDGKYDTRYVADIVFNDKVKLSKLNDIFIPRVIEKYERFASRHELSFFESAIIFENNLQGKFDSVICTYCDPATIIDRLRTRNGFNDDQIESRLKSQISPELKAYLSNFVIDTVNDDIKTKINEFLTLYTQI